jgi:hypothetical protein
MQEELITFETAKLAKEKGFSIPGENIYENEELLCEVEFKNWNNGTLCLSAPTQSLLQRWLREVHKINIVIQYWTGPKPHKPVLHYRTTVNENFFGEHYVTYEEALEEALFESLKLIEL